jgi:hypothetical protein
VGIAAALVRGLLGQRLGVDVHHRRAHLPGNLHKIIGGNRGIDDLEGSGVGAVVLLLLSAHSVSGEGAGHNGGRESGKQDKC